MKTPKTPSVQSKIKTTKHGMIRKSSGSAPARILKSAIKGKEHALSIMKDTEELVKLVKKKSPKKVKMSPSSLFKKTDSGDFKKEKLPRTPKPKDFRNSKTIFKTYTSEIESMPKANSTPHKGKPFKKSKSFKETELESNFKKESVSTDESCDEISILRKDKKKIDILDDSSNQLPSNIKRKSEFTEVKGKKKRKLKLAKNTEKEDRSEDEAEETHGALFNLSNVKNGVEALLKFQSKQKKEERGLFEEEQFLYLQVMLANIAAGPGTSLRILVPHSILPENPDICLLTPDLRGKKNDPEEAIDFYQEVLRKNNITSVTEIIPLRKFKKEYSQYEERRKFRNRFDLFLVDASIMKIVSKMLTQSSKCIVMVRPCDKKKKLKSQIEKAVGRVPLHISGNGLTLNIKCGRVGMPVEHLVDNIVEIGKFLSADKPIIGDRHNINSVYLKDVKSPAIPIFVNLDTAVVPPPAVKMSSQPQPVRGELTTINGASIIVFPSGRVKVIKNKSDKTDAKAKKNETSMKQNKNKKSNQQKDSSDEDLDGSEGENGKEDIDDNTEDGEESSAEVEDGAESKGGESEEEEEGVKSEEDESEDEVKIGEVQSEDDDDESDSEEEGEESEDEEKEEEQSKEEVESEDERDGMKYFNGKLKKHQLQNKKTEFVKKSNKNTSYSGKQKNLKLKNKNVKQR